MWWALLIGFFTLCYLYVKKRFQYFSNLGIAHQPGTFPFGSSASWKMTMGKISFVQMGEDVYKELKEHKLAGYYGMFGTPNFVAMDPELVKKILVKDFEHFVDRRQFDLRDKYLKKMLTTLSGNEWKQSRAALSPIFTSKMLKGILPSMYEVSEDFVKYIKTKADKDDLEVKNLMQLATCEFLGQMGCGVRPNILENPDTNIFYQQLLTLLGQKTPAMQNVKIFIFFLLPKVAEWLKMSFVDPATSEFFATVIK